MNIATPNGTLTAFWVSFPDDPSFPLGLGVTAWSESDACRLLEERGYDFHRRARRVEFRTVDKVDALGLDHVSRGAGPIVVRGLWYGCRSRIDPKSQGKPALVARAGDKVAAGVGQLKGQSPPG